MYAGVGTAWRPVDVLDYGSEMAEGASVGARELRAASVADERSGWSSGGSLAKTCVQVLLALRLPTRRADEADESQARPASIWASSPCCSATCFASLKLRYQLIDIARGAMMSVDSSAG